MQLENLPLDILLCIFTKLNIIDFLYIYKNINFIGNTRLKKFIMSDLFLKEYRVFAYSDDIYNLIEKKISSSTKPNLKLLDFLFSVIPETVTKDDSWLRASIKYNKFEYIKNILVKYSITSSREVLVMLSCKYNRLCFLKYFFNFSKKIFNNIDTSYISELCIKYNSLPCLKFFVDKMRYNVVNWGNIFFSIKFDRIDIFDYLHNFIISENTEEYLRYKKLRPGFYIKALICAFTYKSNDIAKFLISNNYASWNSNKCRKILLCTKNVHMIKYLQNSEKEKNDFILSCIK